MILYIITQKEMNDMKFQDGDDINIYLIERK